MRAALVALVAGGVFLAGVLFGSAGTTAERPIPRPVVLTGSSSAPAPDATPSPDQRGTPTPGALDVQRVERDVEEGSVEDYDDDEYDDNSGPGSDNSGSGSDDSGSGSDDSRSGSDDSGSGSDSSGSGSGSDD
ncbi:MAG TPA: hypothetical protein VHH92_06950 [Actinomycetota bacterium]|nr:hypothetical protein [Actinomycetota bacterium]